MKVLTISDDGYALGIAKKVYDEQFSSIFYVDNGEFKDVGNGVVDKIELPKYLINTDYEPIQSTINLLLKETSPDLVVVDGFRLGKVVAYIRSEGIKVLGQDSWYDTALEDDEYLTKILSRVGVGRCIRDSKLKFVGGCSWNGFECSHTWVGVNHAKWLVEDLGCEVPSACNVMISAHDSQFMGGWWNQLGGLLRKTKFHGFINFELSINSENKIEVVRILPTHLFIPSFLELYQGSFTQALHSLASGNKAQGLLSNDTSCSVLISIPPYPYIANCEESVKVEGINQFNLKHMYLMDMQVSEAKEWSSANGNGALAYITAHGRDLGESSRRITKTLGNLNIPNIQYRTDLFKSSVDILRELKDWM